jgi:hypothetical protein
LGTFDLPSGGAMPCVTVSSSSTSRCRILSARAVSTPTTRCAFPAARQPGGQCSERSLQGGLSAHRTAPWLSRPPRATLLSAARQLRSRCRVAFQHTKQRHGRLVHLALRFSLQPGSQVAAAWWASAQETAPRLPCPPPAAVPLRPMRAGRQWVRRRCGVGCLEPAHSRPAAIRPAARAGRQAMLRRSDSAQADQQQRKHTAMYDIDAKG